MSTTWDPTTNDEATAAWNGVLYDRFVEFRHIIVNGLTAFGEAALELHPPRPGERVLDIGCGFGDTAQRIAGMVGPDGSVLGVDVAERFIETAIAEAQQAGVDNVSFEACDVETTGFPAESFDRAFARMGTMFFANPVAALRHVREALVPGGRLCMVVWRRKLDNEWLLRAEQVVEKYLTEPEETDEPTCGPGPFSMAGADTTSDILLAAGFEAIDFRRCDLPMPVGGDVEEAIAMITGIGPAAEIIRLAGDQASELRPQIEADLREILVDFVRPDGSVWGAASTWIVSARSPGG